MVHEEHGVGRYLGLQTLNVGGTTTEFLALEYARGDKLYVPVSRCISSPATPGPRRRTPPCTVWAAINGTGSNARPWRRPTTWPPSCWTSMPAEPRGPGVAFPDPGDEYAAFAAAFPFEETPDQQRAIDGVLATWPTPKPMDRVVCGDVGFGKTEVAMRAAFMAVHGGRQVAVLVPTTLLAQQHFENFSDRFADWPMRVESLSRFRNRQGAARRSWTGSPMAPWTSSSAPTSCCSNVRFKNLGLVIIDEEHRFGVRHKEHIKALRAEVDVLTLTATPIPRTLNMAMSGLRDLSIIATPPVERHPIKTFVSPWNDALIQEAVLRELKRGGQVYFLHNEVETIENRPRSSRP